MKRFVTLFLALAIFPATTASAGAGEEPAGGPAEKSGAKSAEKPAGKKNKKAAKRKTGKAPQDQAVNLDDKAAMFVGDC